MIRIDPDAAEVLIELPNGETVAIGGYTAEGVERGEARALFVDANEAEVLAKMIDHILQNIRIRPESQAALRAVRPRLDRLFEQ